MSTPRFFVSLDEHGRPLAQRTSVKVKPYLSASYEGSSFSSSPPNGAYPRKVLEVPKAIEWVSRATLEDGTKVSERSKAGPVGRNYVRYRFTRKNYASAHLPEHQDSERWTDRTREDFIRHHLGDTSITAYQVLEFTPGTVEIRNWPTAGDSTVLPDLVKP